MRLRQSFLPDLSLNYIGYFLQPNCDFIGERLTRHYRPRHAAPSPVVRVLLRSRMRQRRGMQIA